jgi:hypothetical protein
VKRINPFGYAGAGLPAVVAEPDARAHALAAAFALPGVIQASVSRPIRCCAAKPIIARTDVATATADDQRCG